VRDLGDAEREFVSRYVAAEQKERFAGLLQRRHRSTKDFHKFSRFVSHRLVLDPERTAPAPEDPTRLVSLLAASGAGDTCILISDTALDGAEVSLMEGVLEVFDGSSGVLLLCRDGEIGMYGSEGGPGERFLCGVEISQ
jgi:hypothetical protein